MQRAIVVGISGASCSGKTWFGQRVFREFSSEAVLIDLDGYYHDLSVVTGLEHGHDNPLSVDCGRAAEDLARLKQGSEIQLPVYDYERHQVGHHRTCQPRRVVLVEGLFAFAHQALRDQLNLKI